MNSPLAKKEERIIVIVQWNWTKYVLGTHLFVKVPAKGLLRSSSQATTCYYQSNHSKVEAFPLSALPKDTTSKLAGLSPHYLFFMLNVKQGSCESNF